MLRTGLVIALLVLSGCTQYKDEVVDCRNRIIDKLKAPSSYKEISAEDAFVEKDIDDPELKNLRVAIDKLNEETGKEPEPKPPYQVVTIKYDAQNSFGAMIRGQGVCKYGMKGSQLNPVKDMPDTTNLLNLSID